MKGKKIIVPTYLCGGCGMTLRYNLVCHYTIAIDKNHKCKPILKPPNQKELEEVAELKRYNESMSYTDKQKILQIDNNKPITCNWRKKR